MPLNVVNRLATASGAIRHSYDRLNLGLPATRDEPAMMLYSILCASSLIREPNTEWRRTYNCQAGNLLEMDSQAPSFFDIILSNAVRFSNFFD